MFELSKIAGRQGEPDRAKEILESAFELSQESVVEARRLEGALRAADDHANLVRALEARIGRSGTPADAADIFGELGRLYENHLGRTADAFELRLRALEIDPAADATHDAAQRLATTIGKLAVYEERVRGLAEAAKNGSAGGGKKPGSVPDSALAGTLFVRLARIAETERKDDREAAKLYEEGVSMRDRDSRSALGSRPRLRAPWRRRRSGPRARRARRARHRGRRSLERRALSPRPAALQIERRRRRVRRVRAGVERRSRCGYAERVRFAQRPSSRPPPTRTPRTSASSTSTSGSRAPRAVSSLSSTRSCGAGRSRAAPRRRCARPSSSPRRSTTSRPSSRCSAATSKAVRTTKRAACGPSRSSPGSARRAATFARQCC